MKKSLYQEAEKFFNSLPASKVVTTCWKDTKNEVPHPADIVVVMDDMYDTVGMASTLLFRMRENNLHIPLFFLLGGENSLLGGNNAINLRTYALRLGIKFQNIRMYAQTPDLKAKFEILNKEAEGKTVVFVTSRLGYIPLRNYIDKYGCNFNVYYDVANENLEDALTWMNGNAAAGGLAFLHKAATLYDGTAELLLPEKIKSFKYLSGGLFLRIILSVFLHRKDIARETNLMIINYHRQFRKRGWFY